MDSNRLHLPAKPTIPPSTDPLSVHKPVSDCLFPPTQPRKSSKKCERRYSDRSDNGQVEAVVRPLPPGPSHFRSKSTHQRKQSIFVAGCTTTEQLIQQLQHQTGSRNSSYSEDTRDPTDTPRHLKKVSDLDAVICMETEEDEAESVRASLPIYGSLPCTARCPTCRCDVHTVVSLSSGMPSPVLQLLSSVFACCQGPAWFNELKVHRCPVCSTVLGKGR